MNEPAAVGNVGRSRVFFIANVPWDHLWQRHQALACQFAREHEVDYCEIPGVRRVAWRDAGRVLRRALRMVVGPASAHGAGDQPPEGLRVLRPWVAPSTNRMLHGINRVVLNRVLRRHPELADGVDTIVVYSAARSALHLVRRVPHQRLVYDCTDNFSAVRGLPACFAEDERWLLRRADLTLVPGRALAEKHGTEARRLEILPHGADLARFLPPGNQPVRRCPGAPTLVYYGHMHRQHFDFELMDELARSNPGWRFVLVGPVMTRWSFPGNVEQSGPREHGRLRDTLFRAQVVILPYVINEYTRCVLPAKTYECLATGLPIVATPLPELESTAGDFIRFASSAESFARQVEDVLLNDREADARARIAEAQRHSWEQAYRRMAGWLSSIPVAGSR